MFSSLCSFPTDAQKFGAAVAKFEELLGLAEAHMASNNTHFLVGHHLTMADLVLASHLLFWCARLLVSFAVVFTQLFV